MNKNILENARVRGNAVVGSNARVGGNAFVGGDAVVEGNAFVEGNAHVEGNAIVRGNAVVQGNARVEGNAVVRGNAVVGEDAVIKTIEGCMVTRFQGRTGVFSLTLYRTARGNVAFRWGCRTGDDLREYLKQSGYDGLRGAPLAFLHKFELENHITLED